MGLKPGDSVVVRVFGGRLVSGRRVVEAHPRGVLVCSEREWLRAGREGRDPAAVGFPVEDVLPGDSPTFPSGHASELPHRAP